MRAAALLWVVLACSGCAARPARVELVHSATALDSYRLTNGVVTVLVVPALGRVTEYGYVGGDNLLWDDPMPDRTPTTQPGRWVNFGGEKIYPWPQDAWPARFGHDWPPPPGLDPLVYHAQVLAPGTLRMTSDVVPAFGLRVIRDLHLAATGTTLTIDTTFEQVTAPEVNWPVAVWSVAQWRSPAVIVAERRTGGGGPMSVPLRGTFAGVDAAGPDRLFFHRPVDDVAKVGIDADRLCVGVGKVWIEERAIAPGPAVANAFDRAQVYCTPAPHAPTSAAYVELEFTSPRRRLAVGERLSLRIEWALRSRAVDRADVP